MVTGATGGSPTSGTEWGGTGGSSTSAFASDIANLSRVPRTKIYSVLDDLHHATDRADAALYAAKREGRDRVHLAADLPV